MSNRQNEYVSIAFGGFVLLLNLSELYSVHDWKLKHQQLCFTTITQQIQTQYISSNHSLGQECVPLIICNIMHMQINGISTNKHL